MEYPEWDQFQKDPTLLKSDFPHEPPEEEFPRPLLKTVTIPSSLWLLFSFSYPSKSKTEKYPLFQHGCLSLDNQRRPTDAVEPLQLTPSSEPALLYFISCISLAGDEEGSIKVQTACLSGIPSQRMSQQRRTHRKHG